MNTHGWKKNTQNKHNFNICIKYKAAYRCAANCKANKIYTLIVYIQLYVLSSTHWVGNVLQKHIDCHWKSMVYSVFHSLAESEGFLPSCHRVFHQDFWWELAWCQHRNVCEGVIITEIGIKHITQPMERKNITWHCAGTFNRKALHCVNSLSISYIHYINVSHTSNCLTSPV